MDSVKGDGYLALVEKKATTGDVVARDLARGYKLLECPKETYYVEMRDYKPVVDTRCGALWCGELIRLRWPGQGRRIVFGPTSAMNNATRMNPMVVKTVDVMAG